MEILQHLTCARNWKENLWSTVNFRNAGTATQSVSAKWLPRSPQEWSMAWVSQPPNPSVTCVGFWESQFGKSNENRPWTFRAPRNLTKSQVRSLTWISCLQYLGIFKIFKKPSHPSQAMVAHRSWQLLSSMFAKVLLIEWNKMTCLQNALFSKKKKQSCSGQSSTIRIFHQLVAWLIMIPMIPANGWNHWGSVLKDSIILSLHFLKVRRQAVSTERYTYYIYIERERETWPLEQLPVMANVSQCSTRNCFFNMHFPAIQEKGEGFWSTFVISYVRMDDVHHHYHHHHHHHHHNSKDLFRPSNSTPLPWGGRLGQREHQLFMVDCRSFFLMISEKSWELLLMMSFIILPALI